jgi:hypothetical protein
MGWARDAHLASHLNVLAYLHVWATPPGNRVARTLLWAPGGVKATPSLGRCASRRGGGSGPRGAPPRPRDGGSLRFRTGDQRPDSRNVVEYSPAANRGSARRRAWSGRLVLIPSTRNSATARRMRLMASPRSAPCAITLATSES